MQRRLPPLTFGVKRSQPIRCIDPGTPDPHRTGHRPGHRVSGRRHRPSPVELQADGGRGHEAGVVYDPAMPASAKIDMIAVRWPQTCALSQQRAARARRELDELEAIARQRFGKG